MTSENPAWVKGATVTLHGKEAETFVRSRMTVGAGTNEERMVRQAEYMRQAIKKMTQKISGDLAFGESLLKSLEQISTTNRTAAQITDCANEQTSMITTVDHEIEKINRVQAVVETSMNQMVDTNREVERETNTLIEDLLQNRKTS